ncbi:MAG TPA: hypothetical protein VGC13_17205 [Longimicrobium sp.]|jgi:hypothetical protein
MKITFRRELLNAAGGPRDDPAVFRASVRAIESGNWNLAIEPGD